MATHSSILAWRIPWTEKPGGLQFIGSHRVRHDCSNLAHTHTQITKSNLSNLKKFFLIYLLLIFDCTVSSLLLAGFSSSCV